MQLTFHKCQVFFFCRCGERREVTTSESWQDLLFTASSYNRSLFLHAPHESKIHAERFYFLMQTRKILLDQGKRASVFPLQNATSDLHAGIKFCQRAFTLPRDLPPFLFKLFDQFDSFKQNTALCFFRANFPLHRWRISVYFSFIFNGRPFRHWTREPSSSCTLRSAVALSSSEASLTARVSGLKLRSSSR